MLCRGANLQQVFFDCVGNIRLVEGNVVQADDGVHGRADFVAHVGEESRLGLAGLLCCRERIRKRLLLLEARARFGIDVGEARPDIVDDSVISVFGVADSSEAHRLVGLIAVDVDHVAIRDDVIVLKSLAYGFGLNEVQEFLAVLLQDVMVAVFGHGFEIVELFAGCKSG